MDTYLPRTLEYFISGSATRFPVILLTGARQVGKTTLLRHLSAQNRTYVSLDDPLARSLATEEPALFMQRFVPPVVIDEIQYAPDLLVHIKMDVDEKHEAGRFWLTGSQHFHLMRGVSESLAGRVGIVKLLGFSKRELTGRSANQRPFLPIPEELDNAMGQHEPMSLHELYEHIWRGSFPQIALDRDLDWELFYGSFVQTYLQRDIHELTRVGDEMSFLRFLRAAAARSGQLLNLTRLARAADIAVNTAKSWLSILEASGVIYLLFPYHTNLTRRLVKTPKLYFLDTGLCAYLTGWSDPKTLEAGAMSGAILETWIICELIKSYWHNGRQAPFYFYRDKDKKEIDLLIVLDGVIYPLEIKKTASPGKADVRHFRVLEKLNRPVGPGGVICLVKQALPLTSAAWTIPATFI